MILSLFFRRLDVFYLKLDFIVFVSVFLNGVADVESAF